MARSEFFIPQPQPIPSFEKEISYSKTSGHVEVARETTLRMQNYFDGAVNWPWHVEYLEAQTLVMVEAAKKGLLANPQAVRDIGLIDPPTYNALLDMNKQYEEDDPAPEDAEAFARMQLGFGMIPEITERSGLPKGFSRLHLVEPPFTTEEVMGRIHEVEVTVKKLRDKKIDPKMSLINQPSVLRTYLVFEAMATMPLRNPLSDKNNFTEEAYINMRERFSDPANR